MTQPTESTATLRLLGAFLAFATSMAALASFLLAFPGTPLDGLWSLNPRAHIQLASLGKPAAVAFLFLSVFAAYVTVLWFQRRSRGWCFAVVGIALQALGDAVNFFRGDRLAGLIGLLIASALLGLLLSRRVRSAFH